MTKETIKKTNYARQGIINRRKGHNAERLYVNIFRDMGFEFCTTARMGSRMLDNAQIDIIYLPFNVQIKAGAQVGLKPEKVLSLMQEKMEEFLPPTSLEIKQPKVLIHHKDVGRGNKRTEFDSIVSMTFDDFIKIIKKVKEW